MGLHKQKRTHEELCGLDAHGLPLDGPSQLSDAFLLGMRYARQVALEFEDLERITLASSLAKSYMDSVLGELDNPRLYKGFVGVACNTVELEYRKLGLKPKG